MTATLGGFVSTSTSLNESTARPSFRLTTRIRYSPSGTTLPSSSRPSQRKRYLASPASSRSSTSRRISFPSSSRIENEISARSERSKPTRRESCVPSPFGEKAKGEATAKRSTTGSSVFSDWVTKNAATVAPTSSAKTPRRSGLESTGGNLSFG